MSVGPVSGQTRSRCSAGGSLCPAHQRDRCGSLPVCSPAGCRCRCVAPEGSAQLSVAMPARREECLHLRKLPQLRAAGYGFVDGRRDLRLFRCVKVWLHTSIATVIAFGVRVRAVVHCPASAIALKPARRRPTSPAARKHHNHYINLCSCASRRCGRSTPGHPSSEDARRRGGRGTSRPRPSPPPSTPGPLRHRRRRARYRLVRH